MTRYLQLHVHSLQCVQETQNRQNFLGISLETDPDSIDLSAVIVDAGEGVVAQPPTVFLGNRYRSGHTERFSPARIVAEVPIREDDVFPRHVSLSLNMAEKDDGGGFDELMERVAGELADTLSEEIGGELGEDVTSSDIYEEVENIAGDLLASILKEIGNALGLGDDPFRPVDVTVALSTYAGAAPSGTHTATFREPNPAHKGEFRMTYSWQLADRPSLDTITARDRGDTGAAAAPLTKAGGYPRGYLTRRFRAPVKAKKTPAPRIILPRVRRQKIKLGNRTISWYPTPLRIYGGLSKR